MFHPRTPTTVQEHRQQHVHGRAFFVIMQHSDITEFKIRFIVTKCVLQYGDIICAWQIYCHARVKQNT